MLVKFTKMTGAGNDFVVIDNRRRHIRDGSKAARYLCDRRWGIGADGLLLLEKSKRGDYKMMYYNADGSYGGMCGNGGRCIASFAVAYKIASKKHQFEALNYIYHAEVSSNRVKLSMKDPSSLKLEDSIDLGTHLQSFSFVDTGSPHVVIPLEEIAGDARELADVDLATLGPRIRHHSHFAPAGVNVNIIQRTGPNSLEIRTYERGVEAETLACGTGAIAAAIVAARKWGSKPPIRILPKSNVPLMVQFKDSNGAITNVRLIGPATTVYHGEIRV